MPSSYKTDLTGMEYGFLSVKKYDDHKKKWICECRCGRRIAVRSNNLKSGNTASCGRCGYSEAAKRDVAGGTRVSQLEKKLCKNNTSGVTGVGYNKRKNKWYAAITFRGKDYWLGYHEHKEDAVRARREAEENLHADFLAWLKEEYPDRWEQLKKRDKIMRKTRLRNN